MSHLPMYYLGFIVLVAGLAWGAFTLGVPPTWIAIGCVITAGLAMMSAFSYRATTLVSGGRSVTVMPSSTVTERTII